MGAGASASAGELKATTLEDLAKSMAALPAEDRQKLAAAFTLSESLVSPPAAASEPPSSSGKPAGEAAAAAVTEPCEDDGKLASKATATSALETPADGFELIVRWMSGEVLKTIAGAQATMTRREIVSQLKPSKTHVYEVLVGKESLRGSRTLASCGIVIKPGEAVEVSAVMTENKLLKPMHAAHGKVIDPKSKNDLQEIWAMKNPTPDVGRIMGSITKMFGVDGARPAKDVASFVEMVLKFDPDEDPSRIVAAIADVCDTLTPKQVNCSSMTGAMLLEWLIAVCAYSRSVL